MNYELKEKEIIERIAHAPQKAGNGGLLKMTS